MEGLPELDLPLAPSWSIAVGTAGRWLVWAGVALFLIAALLWLFEPRLRSRRFVVATFVAGTACVFGTFACLAALFVANRFEYTYVYGHGDLRNAVAYRIAGVWSGQEGSFLLWAMTSALFGLAALRGTGTYLRWFGTVYSLFLASLCGILAFESPFVLNLIHGKPFVPPDGVGLTPALQNYWVIIHPPTIFLGFGSLTVLFAYAFAALCSRNAVDWVPRARPWALIALTLVGLGLCMGGLWAYETLGWGGFWAWDPVENTSFVPWCLTVALVHGMIVQTARKRWHASNLLLGGAPFIAFVYGTFLTRSGLLGETSVHSFAEMDNQALKLLLGVLGVASVGFLGAWLAGLRAMPKPDSVPMQGQAPIHREALYRLGSTLFVILAFATSVGMSVPMFMSVFGRQPKVVEEWLYHRVMPWLFIPILLLVAAGPFVGWRGIGLRDLLGRLYGIACVTFALVGLTMLVLMKGPWGRLADLDSTVSFPFGWKVLALPWVLVLLGICYFAAVANVWRIAEVWKSSRSSLATFLSHVGVGVLLAGLIVSRGLERKVQVAAQEGVPVAALGYVLDVKSHTKDLTDRDNKVLIELSADADRFTARPGLYYKITPQGEANPMVWPHVQRRMTNDIYLTLHPMVLNASDAVELKPGETRQIEPYTVKYSGMVREGEPGASGTTFGAKLEVRSGDSVLQVVPKLELTRNGLQPAPAEVDADYYFTLVGMDAATKSVSVQLNYKRPIYPIEVFYKPLTGLVWLGLGILTLGGLLAAWHRRFRGAATTENISERPAESPADAPAPSP